MIAWGIAPDDEVLLLPLPDALEVAPSLPVVVVEEMVPPAAPAKEVVVVAFVESESPPPSSPPSAGTIVEDVPFLHPSHQTGSPEGVLARGVSPRGLTC